MSLEHVNVDPNEKQVKLFFRGRPFDDTLSENEEAIQASLMEVINAIARNTIDLRRADLILKALHIAVKNSRRVQFDYRASTMVDQIPDYELQPKLPSEASVTVTAIETAGTA